MQQLTSSFVLGYHGCDREVAERLLLGQPFRKSRNRYDWLGSGIYFWESDPRRGLQFAREQKRRSPGLVQTPTVVGAVIELGLCLDLTTAAGVRQVRAAHDQLVQLSRQAGQELPRNSTDLLRRNLDCAVIELLHRVRGDQDQRPVDTVRGMFVEGAPLYEGSGFREKTHTQIAVRNPNSIKGVFRVPTRFLR